MMTDPIADMLTRIRNAVRVEKPFVDMPYSNLKRGIAQALRDEGYVWDFEEVEVELPRKVARDPVRRLRVHLKYGPNGEKVIESIQRVSTPGRRVHRGYRDLGRVRGGMGIFVLSTPRGILSDRRARAEKVGGEVLAEVY